MTVNRTCSQRVSDLAIEALPLLIDQKRLHCWLLTVFRGSVIECPQCAKPLEGKARRTFVAGRRTRCRSCETMIGYWQGTPLHAMKIDPVQFYLLACFGRLGAKGQDIEAVLGIGKSTEGVWRKRFQEMIIEGCKPCQPEGCNCGH